MSIQSIYNIYSNFYDLLFSSTFNDARRKAISSLDLDDSKKTIEFGIGTGLSLKYFPRKYNGLTGIDLSDKMLARCIKKVKMYNMNVDLRIMDCEHTTFENEIFDYVILMFVYSVTHNPDQLLKEAFRICKCSGTVIIVNHFSNVEGKKLNIFEYILSFFENSVGFRSNFSFREYIIEKKLILDKLVNANFLSITKVIFLKKSDNLHIN
jgi:phosphatidylethanolamine/phosphatidyl-N-methylethanolamine N-methyltransferase